MLGDWHGDLEGCDRLKRLTMLHMRDSAPKEHQIRANRVPQGAWLHPGLGCPRNGHRAQE